MRNASAFAAAALPRLRTCPSTRTEFHWSCVGGVGVGIGRMIRCCGAEEKRAGMDSAAGKNTQRRHMHANGAPQHFSERACLRLSASTVNRSEISAERRNGFATNLLKEAPGGWNGPQLGNPLQRRLFLNETQNYQKYGHAQSNRPNSTCYRKPHPIQYKQDCDNNQASKEGRLLAFNPRPCAALRQRDPNARALISGCNGIVREQSVLTPAFSAISPSTAEFHKGAGMRRICCARVKWSGPKPIATLS